MTSIYLIGDGILDNSKYLEDKNNDLKKELINLGCDVYNYAKEEMKINDILASCPPILLNGNINKRVDNMSIISIGGNDISSKIPNVVLGIDYLMNSVLTSEFKTVYENIIQKITINCKKILLISMYLPYLGSGSSYGKYSSFSIAIMNKWNEFLFSIAKKYNIPVLDLNKTLNNQDRSHYGIDDTRVSNISSKCMAKCITYINKHYDGYSVYYSPNCDYTKICRSRKL